MKVAPPRRLIAVGGPSTPDDRVQLALTTPIIGQFDPAFTEIMDEVMQLGRAVLLTRNARCFPISALPSAGVESLLNSLVTNGLRVRALGSSDYRAFVSDIVERYGGTVSDAGTLTVAPHVDPYTGEAQDIALIARECHASGSLVLVDATYSLGGRELRTDDWQLDAVVAGVDYCIGAPSGMTLVTYSAEVEQRLQPEAPTSYLDLRQLQAYWSPERLNHHTAPTSLVYGLREALRLMVDEGLEACWQRHATVFEQLRNGLESFNLHPEGSTPLLLVEVPESQPRRDRLLHEHCVHVHAIRDGTWRLSLIGADAQPSVAATLLAALRSFL